jgi:hypothetical protein
MAANAAQADPLVVTTDVNCTILDYGILSPKPGKFADSGPPKLTARILTPKGSDSAKKLIAAEAAAKQERWGNRPPVGFRSAIIDGDAVDGAGQRVHPDYYAGMIAVTAKAAVDRAPTCWVGKERRKAEPSDFYSGMQGAAVVRAFAYDRESRGVSFGLNLIWKTGPGTKIATGGVDAEASALSMASQVSWSDDSNLAGSDALS